jgi:hypothetical protein
MIGTQRSEKAARHGGRCVGVLPQQEAESEEMALVYMSGSPMMVEWRAALAARQIAESSTARRQDRNDEEGRDVTAGRQPAGNRRQNAGGPWNRKSPAGRGCACEADEDEAAGGVCRREEKEGACCRGSLDMHMRCRRQKNYGWQERHSLPQAR